MSNQVTRQTTLAQLIELGLMKRDPWVLLDRTDTVNAAAGHAPLGIAGHAKLAFADPLGRRLKGRGHGLLDQRPGAIGHDIAPLGQPLRQPPSKPPDASNNAGGLFGGRGLW